MNKYRRMNVEKVERFKIRKEENLLTGNNRSTIMQSFERIVILGCEELFETMKFDQIVERLWIR